MRIRAVLVALFLLVLAACSQEAGPTPKGAPQDPGPAGLRVKLEALSVDPCYRSPARMPAQDCLKYVTQLGSIPGTAKDYAGSGHPRLADAANDLAAGIQAYRGNRCDRGGDTSACATALTDISTALQRMKGQLDTLPEAEAPSS